MLSPPWVNFLRSFWGNVRQLDRMSLRVTRWPGPWATVGPGLAKGSWSIDLDLKNLPDLW